MNLSVQGGKFLVQVICIPRKAPVQLDVHLTRGKIHHIIGVPDPAVFLDFLITDSDSIAISVLLNLQPMPVIPVPDIHLPVPNQARYHVFLVLALLVSLDHQLDELFLSQSVVDIKHSRIQQHIFALLYSKVNGYISIIAYQTGVCIYCIKKLSLSK